MKIVTDLRTVKAEQTGIYRGPGGDYRFQKAGSDIPVGPDRKPLYQYSHKPGEQPAAAEKTGK